LDYTKGTTLNIDGASTSTTGSSSMIIPAISTRRADTTIELGSGQSFAIAGLFQNNISNSMNALPGLGDIPILGALFRSTQFQRNQTELVIIVTPYIVQPAKANNLSTPIDTIKFASPLETVMEGRLNRSSDASLQGNAGFYIE
jgi:pilus assembly protein CpaC